MAPIEIGELLEVCPVLLLADIAISSMDDLVGDVEPAFFARRIHEQREEKLPVSRRGALTDDRGCVVHERIGGDGGHCRRP